MSTVYTPRQIRFIHIFMHHTQPLLKSFLRMESTNPHPGSPGNNTTDVISDGVNTLSAAVAIAGIVGAAPTLGTSVGGASACIVLLKTLNGCSKFVRRHIENKDEPFSPDETKQDEIHLSLTILLKQIAHLAAVRYRHFIDEILKDQSINTFASFVGDRAMKKLAIDLADHVDLSTQPNADSFLDYFMASAKLSFTQDPTQVVIKDEYTESGRCSPAAAYAKLACSRPGLAVYNHQSPGEYTLYVSPTHTIFQTGSTTLQQHYGFATVPQSELRSETAAVNRKELKPLPPEIMKETLNVNKPHFSVYYPVSRQEVSDYLTEIRLTLVPNQPVKSLNQYLSERHNTNLIAACNDGRLRGLDLSNGNFSEVWFIGNVDLSDCNLCNTTWVHAHLNGARFEKNDLTGSNFQHVHAEKSIWTHLIFSGDFSHAKLNGSIISNCSINSMFNQFGCEWHLVEMENVKKEDAVQLLSQRFDERLTQEHQERIQLNDEISALSHHYEACIQRVIENHELNVKEEHELELLHKKVCALEIQYSQHLTQQNIKLDDLKRHVLLAQNDQKTRLDKQDKAIEGISKRLEKLEQESTRSSPSVLTGLSMFKPKPHQNRQDSSEHHKSAESVPSNYVVPNAVRDLQD